MKIERMRMEIPVRSALPAKKGSATWNKVDNAGASPTLDDNLSAGDAV